MSQQQFNFSAIGETQSCFKEKFGIPRQAGLAPSTPARILIYPEFARPEAFADLQQCSHIWLQFVFHAADAAWRPKVRPPRLGGNKSVGVFATRSPNRPNPIGLSVVRYLGATQSDQGFFIHIGGADLLDGTPILDIKPYVPYADSVPHAVNTIAPAAPPSYPVEFSAEAKAFCEAYEARSEQGSASLTQVVCEILQQDPRPQYQMIDETRVYGMRLFDLNIRWQYCCQKSADKAFSIYVLAIDALNAQERDKK